MGIAGSSSYLGVDIGFSSIKVVELKKTGGQVILSTYGFSEKIINASGNPGRLDVKKAAETLKSVCAKAGIATNMAVCSLSTFSVFSSIITVNSTLNAKDMEMAVNWEAKKVIPIPIEDVVLYWQKIEEDSAHSKLAKVLLIGAPANLVRDYVEIFKQSQLSLLSLETEVFALIRCLLSQDKSTTMIVQLGGAMTNIFIVDNGVPVLSRSIDVGGLAVTRALSKGLNISLADAEQFKIDLVHHQEEEDKSVDLPKAVIDTLGPIINEIRYIIEVFVNKENKKIDKVLLTGGGALLFGLPNYLSSILNLNVMIGDPWFRVAYPKEMKQSLEALGPKMSVAIGLAMEHFDKNQ